jgi:hypothetical protein
MGSGIGITNAIAKYGKDKFYQRNYCRGRTVRTHYWDLEAEIVE